jgi:hypothetical protein
MRKRRRPRNFIRRKKFIAKGSRSWIGKSIAKFAVTGKAFVAKPSGLEKFPWRVNAKSLLSVHPNQIA